MVLIVMSHGDEGGARGQIITSDDKDVDIERDIIRPLNNANCPMLRGKPKIIIINACSGSSQDLGVEVVVDRTPGATAPARRKEPENKDMLIAYSSCPGYVSVRNSENGSWFVQDICEVFSEHSHDTDVRDMLDMVSENLIERESDTRLKQQCTIESRGFTKKLYFHPGLDIPED